MSLESGQRLSVEELKQLNWPKTMPPQPAPIPPEHPTQQEWNELRAALKRLEASVSAQEALLRALNRRDSSPPRPSWRRWREMWPK